MKNKKRAVAVALAAGIMVSSLTGCKEKTPGEIIVYDPPAKATSTPSEPEPSETELSITTLPQHTEETLPTQPVPDRIYDCDGYTPHGHSESFVFQVPNRPTIKFSFHLPEYGETGRITSADYIRINYGTGQEYLIGYDTQAESLDEVFENIAPFVETTMGTHGKPEQNKNTLTKGNETLIESGDRLFWETRFSMTQSRTGGESVPYKGVAYATQVISHFFVYIIGTTHVEKDNYKFLKDDMKNIVLTFKVE